MWYVALDQIFLSVNDVLAELGEERLPIPVPQIDAPVAMAASGGDGFVQLDLFLPMELLIAGKNAGMAMMGSMMAPQPAPAPAPVPTESDQGGGM